MKVESSDAIGTLLMLLAGATAGLMAVFALSASGGGGRSSTRSSSSNELAGERVNVSGMDGSAQKLLKLDPVRRN